MLQLVRSTVLQLYTRGMKWCLNIENSAAS